MASRRAARSRLAAAAADPGLAFLDSKLRLVGVGLICAWVAFVPLVFDFGADWPFTVPKALLSHSLAYAIAGVLAAVIVRFDRPALVWSWLHVPVVAFLVANVAATIFAEDRLLALYGAHARMLGLGTIAAWTVLYFGVVTLIRTRRDTVALVVAGLIAAVLILGYELVQLLGLDPFRWSNDPSLRPFSTNGQATSLAAYLTMLAVSTVAGAIALRHEPRWIRLALFVLTGALLAGAAATGTRSALIGLASGSAVLVLLVWFKHPSRRARVIGIATATAAVLGLAAILALTPIGGRMLQVTPVAGDSAEDNLARLDLASVDVRAVLYQVAVEVVRERPLLGYGPDNFVVGMTRYRPEQGPDEARLSYATSAHSWIGQIATGSGLTGLAAFLAVIAGVGLLTARSGFEAVPVVVAAALAAHLGTGLTSVTDVGSDWVFWMGAALIAGAYARNSNVEYTPAASRSSRRRAARPGIAATSWQAALAAVCIVVGISLALTPVRALDASRSARLSQDSRLVGRVDRAVAAGLAATTADPGRPEYWQRLGLAYVAGARWREAATSLERAIALAPWDVRTYSDLVATQLILARDGDAAARARAVQLGDDAVRRDPNYPTAHFVRAVVMQFTGSVPEGLRSIERALALRPQTRISQWYIVATQLYVAAGRAADGIRAAEAGVLVADSPQLRIELARTLLGTGQPREALVHVESALAVDPGNTAAQRLRAEIMAAITN